MEPPFTFGCNVIQLPVIWLAANAKGLISHQTGLISRDIKNKVA
jgi:hypothetical protein